MIRLATPEDLPQILRMAYSFHQVSPYKDTIFSTEKVTQLINSFLVGSIQEKLLLVLESFPGHLNGLLAGQITETLFGSQKQAIEVMWWVDPEYRGRESIKLMEAYQDWALRFNADLIHMSLLETEHKESLERFYRKKGFSQCEISFVKFI